jgi:2-dehydropantoate 2-reductase
MTEILIVGTGAMALLFGSRLAAAGQQVTLLGTWKKGLKALKDQGIRVIEEGVEDYYPVDVIDDIDGIKNVRLALVLVKSWQTERAAGQLSKILDSDGIALTLQNGLGNLNILSTILGNERTAQGVTTYGATLVAPGVVRPAGEGLISLQKHTRLTEIRNNFQDAGLSVQEVADLSGMVWEKLIVNVAINPLTALLDVENGKLLLSKYSREIMARAAEEAAAVAVKSGIKLRKFEPKELAESVAAATAKNFSSMLQDVRRGAPTEIDALCGEVVSRGKAVNVLTPTNYLLGHLVKTKLEIREID